MKRITKVECEIGFELTLMHIGTMGYVHHFCKKKWRMLIYARTLVGAPAFLEC